MFEFDYEYGAKEMQEASNFMLKKYLTVFKILLVFLFALDYLVKYLQTREIKHVITLIIFLLFISLMFYFTSKASNKLALNNNKKFLGMRINIKFTDSNILVKTRKENSFESSNEYEWKMIHKISQNNLYYFIYLSRIRAYTIPKGSCVVGNETEFFSFIENKIKNT